MKRILLIFILLALVFYKKMSDEYAAQEEVLEEGSLKLEALETPDWLKNADSWSEKNEKTKEFFSENELNLKSFLKEELGIEEVAIYEDDGNKSLQFNYLGYNYLVVTENETGHSFLFIGEENGSVIYRPISIFEMEMATGKKIDFDNQSLYLSDGIEMMVEIETINNLFLALFNDPYGIACPFDRLMPHTEISTKKLYDLDHTTKNTKKARRSGLFLVFLNLIRIQLDLHRLALPPEL